MKNMIKVLWYIIVSAMVLAMFVMVTSKVFAHGQGKCITDPSGNVFLSDDSYVKIDGHLKGKKLDIKGDEKPPYLHGHRQQYYDANDNPTAPSTSFWDIDFDDPNSPYYGVFDKFYVDCPTAPSPPPATVTRTPDTSVRSAVSQQYVGTYYPYPRIVRKPVEVAPSCEEIDLQEFLWQGETMLSLRLLPQGVETISDLWNAYGLSVDKGNTIKTLLGNWATYDNVTPLLQGMADLQLWKNMGMVIEQTRGTLINIEGCPVENSQKILIQEGDNLIGFPEVPDLFKLPSDFLSDKVVAVKVQRGTPWGAVYHTIAAVGDEGDNPLRAGQAVILTSTEPHWINLSEPPPAAPMAPHAATLAMSWGAMKERR